MLKWVWKLYQGEDAIWARLIRAKYTDTADIFSCAGQGGSAFWKSLHQIKDLFKIGAKHEVNDGRRTQFWYDNWHPEGVLRDRFPLIFSICENTRVSVAQACTGQDPLRLRRTLDANGRAEWDQLIDLIEATQISTGPDKISWSLEPSGEYSVSSMYLALSRGASVVHFRDMWAAKLPLKIRIFTWQLALNRLPTREALAHRRGPSDGRCALCGDTESASHLFFTCSLARFGWSVVRQMLGCRWSPSSFPQFFHILSTFAGRPRRFIWVLFAALCWSLWKVRNRHIFQAKVIRQPTDIIYPWIILLQQWLPAARPQDKAGLELLVERLRRVHAELTATDDARTQGVG
jgi:hypothetical protein